MDAPPVQYTTTSDGFRIAYAAMPRAGQGETLIYVPFPIQTLGHVSAWSWTEDWGQHPQLSRLATVLRLARYDTRGQGLSTRGLDDSHSLEAYERDLEAVVERLGVDQVVLMGGALASHVALRYAVHHPERVRALILYGTDVTYPTSAALNLDLAASDWHLFLHSFLAVAHSNENISPEERRQAVAGMKDCVNQSDYLQYARVAATSSVLAVAPLVTSPTLVIAESRHLSFPREGAARLASLIPNARLVTIDESAGMAATAQPALDFLAELPASEAPSTDARRRVVPPPNTLSPREVQILRLVAAGKSSREIGETLVLSVRTVERHIANVYLKTETHGRAQITNYARDNGLY